MLIVCAGMLRSGSTLQYNVARLLVSGMESGFSHGYFGEKDLLKCQEELHKWRTDEVFHILKTHELISASLKSDDRVIYIYRDLRDVAVSAKKKFGQNFEQVMVSLEKAVEICTLVEQSSNALIQRYENVTLDVREAAIQQANYLGLNPPDGLLDEIASECAVSNMLKATSEIKKTPLALMKRIMGYMGISIQVFDKQTLLHPDHLSENAGAIGVWKNELPNSELALIEQKFGDWLFVHGYERSI